MSSFYSSIAPYYEKLFPVGESQTNLLQKLAGTPPKNILDIACGIGSYSKYLHSLGHTLTSIDLNNEMLEEFRDCETGIEIITLSMEDISELDKSFHFIFCIGNSLVHLNSQTKIKKLVIDAYHKLERGGQFLVQIVNYDIKRESLPTIINEESNIIFQRLYHEKGSRLDFHTILKTEDGIMENHEILLPVTSDTLISYFEEAGFITEAFGDFKENPFIPTESQSLVLIGSKK